MNIVSSTISALIILGLTLPATTSEADDLQLSEDAWWQTDTREHRLFFAMGTRASFLDTAETPTDVLFPEVAQITWTFGSWVTPMLGFEGQLYHGGGEDDGFFDYGSVSRDTFGLRGGVRFALPIYITPTFAAHLDYSYLKNEWFDSRDGSLFGSEGDDPTSGVYGTDRHHALGLNTELGLAFNYGRFTSSLQYHVMFNLAHDAKRDRIRTKGAVDDMLRDEHYTLPANNSFFEEVGQGIELRVGLRL